MPYIEHFFKHDHGFKLNDVNALKGLKQLVYHYY